MKRFLVPLLQLTQSETVPPKKICESKNESNMSVIDCNDPDIQKNIFDLSQKLEDGPSQPDFTFPRRNNGGKRRSFNNSWYKKYAWLEYSKIKDFVFCFYCRHFTLRTLGYSDNTLIFRGYYHWKHIGKMLEKHDSSNIHKNSFEKYKSWTSAKKNRFSSD